jgi:methylated-DNA-protein-cysteine methyltransferase-like protein
MGFTERAKILIARIPRGKVATYGQISVLAGSSTGSRQVARILHSCSEKDHLPWHRVINSRGGISLPRGRGYEIQREKLTGEGIVFEDVVDLKRYLWHPKPEDLPRQEEQYDAR